MTYRGVNALAESFNGLYKTELIYHERPWAGPDQVQRATLTYVHWFNTKCLHSAIGVVTPAEFEAANSRQRRPSEMADSHVHESL